jgi:UDP-N-acetylmuramyl tripeptide synthase
MRFRLATPAGERDFHSPLVGPPHIYNTLARSRVDCAWLQPRRVTAALEKCTGAPGRFERVPRMMEIFQWWWITRTATMRC